MLGNPMNFHSDFLRILPLSLSITPLGSLSLRGAVLHSVVPARCRRSEEGAPSLVLLSIATADSPPSIDGRSSCLFPQRRWLHAPSSYPWQPSLAHAARILQNSPSSPTLSLVSLPSLVLQSSYWHPLFSLLDRFSLSVFRVANHISLVPIAAPSADARHDACHHVFRGLDGQQPRSSSGCSSSGLRVSSSSLMVLTLLTRAFRSSDGSSGADPYDKPGDSSPAGGNTVGAGGIPGGLPGGPTCVMEATTTVFVTVYPTSPIVTVGGSPDGSGSDQTLHGTTHPTRTIQVSPINSAQATELAPSPFTTITIDVSGGGPGSDGNSGPVTGSPSGSSGQDGSSPSGAQSNDSPASYYGGSGSPGPNSATATTGPITDTANAPHGGSPWYTVVTDSSVQWVTGSDGPKPVTILSEHTLTIGGISTNVPDNGNSLTCITTIGPDGRPTIVEWPVGGTQGANGGQPISTAAGVTVDINGNPVPQGASTVIHPSTPVVTGMDSQGAPPVGGPPMSTACTTYTVLGTDGIPTVVHSSWLIPQNAPPTAASGALPTAGPAPAQIGNIPNGDAVTTCTTYTILGADGKPTVVESTLVLPGAQSTQAGVPGALSSGIPGSPGPVISGGAGSQPGITTCTTYTVLGADGRPTIVDTTYLVPGPVATPVVSNVGGGVVTGTPGQPSGSPGQPLPGNAGQPGITTCLTYTAIGPDGRPTIVESTVVMPASDAVPTASGLGLPSAVPPQQSGLPQGISVTAGNLITTAVTVDVLGPNGVATPVVETIVLTPSTNGVSVLPTVTSLGFPSIAPDQMPTNLPQGIPPFTPGNAVTTCVTVDIVGPNGVATPLVQTIVLTPIAPGSGNPTAGPIANTAGLPLPLSGQVPGLSTAVSGVPPLDAYGSEQPNLQTVFPPSAAVSGIDGLPTGITPGSGNTVYTIVTGSNGIPVLSPVTGLPLPSYGSSEQAGAVPGNNGAPAGAPTGAGQVPNGYGWGESQAGAAYGPLSFGAAATALQTATWTNIIPEQTTTYTINFPFTTLVTVAVPDKHALKRQVRLVCPNLPLINFANHGTGRRHHHSLLHGQTLRPHSCQAPPHQSLRHPPCLIMGVRRCARPGARLGTPLSM